MNVYDEHNIHKFEKKATSQVQCLKWNISMKFLAASSFVKESVNK